ncbi:MAG: prealbumin-like fold domain-containing protein [Eubacteriaceae bacterium]|nr:prealbumin-like fold domain-containing protein [Eubacteriaceae bacterium]
MERSNKVFYQYDEYRPQEGNLYPDDKRTANSRQPTTLYVPPSVVEASPRAPAPAMSANYRNVMFTLTKLDIASGKRIPGAVYEMRGSNGSMQLLSTNEGGMATFNIGAGASYRLREVSAAEGYRLDESIYAIDVSPNGSVRLNGSIGDKITVPAIGLG